MQTLRTCLRLSCGWVGLVSTLVFLFSAGWSAVGYAQITAYPVTVFKNGSGSGMVTSVGLFPDEIDCGLMCSGFGPENGSVTLTAVPDAGSTFIGWVGRGCSGTGTCSFTVDQASTVAAMFGTGTGGFSSGDLAGTWLLLDAHGLRRRE